jgi:hypothetical protein
VQLLQKKRSGQLLRYQQERQRKQQQQQHERRDEQDGEEEGEEGDYGLEQQQRQSTQQLEGLVYEMETDGGGDGEEEEEEEEEEHRRQQKRLHDAAWALTNSGWSDEGSWSSEEAPYTPPLRRTISSPLVKSKTIGNYTQQVSRALNALIEPTLHLTDTHRTHARTHARTGQ